MDDDRKFFEALQAVATIARSNFPGKCEIVVSIAGENTAVVTIPSYILDRLLAGPTTPGRGSCR